MSRHPTERDPLLNGSQNPKKQQPGPLDLPRSTRVGILAGVWLATFLSAFNQTMVPTMLTSISSEFNKSNQASWLGTAYLLATCTFTPLYGRLCNVLGRKGANITALLFAALGCIMCGLSRNMEMLIAARFLAGMGGGGLFTTSSIVVSDMYSIRDRGLAQGVASVFNGLGLGLGGPFGGFVTDWLGWRWAFLVQIPFFFISYCLTSYNLCYVTPGKGKSTKEILKRIDYGGSAMLLVFVSSVLVFLSERFNNNLPWGSPTVVVSLVLATTTGVMFVVVELYVAPEPILAPFLLKQKIPILVGISNFLVATCNFSIMYFFPMWFQTVQLANASTAGAHLLPNSLAMSTGSMFAGWMMHKTGKYKTINLIFGFFPFIGATAICLINENSGFLQSWFSIIPLGFGNAVVLQTMLIALLVHLPENCVAVGTGFGQLFRGVGQVGGVAISSAIFQSKLDSELNSRITGPNAKELISRIRRQAKVVATLPHDVQRQARDSYDASLKAVFVFAACMTFLAFCIRLPIPEKELESQPTATAQGQSPKSNQHRDEDEEDPTLPPSRASEVETIAAEDGYDGGVGGLSADGKEDLEAGTKSLFKKRSRRLSGFEFQDDTVDPAEDVLTGSQDVNQGALHP